MNALAPLFAMILLAPASVVVLKDGSVYRVSKPVQSKGKTAVLTLENGQLVSVPTDQIDEGKSRAANAAGVPEAAAPTPVPVFVKPSVTQAHVKERADGKKSRDLSREIQSGPVPTAAPASKKEDEGKDEGDGEKKDGKKAATTRVVHESHRVPVLSIDKVSDQGSGGISASGYTYVSGMVTNRGEADACSVEIAIHITAHPDDARNFAAGWDATHRLGRVNAKASVPFEASAQAPAGVVKIGSSSAKIASFEKCQ